MNRTYPLTTAIPSPTHNKKISILMNCIIHEKSKNASYYRKLFMFFEIFKNFFNKLGIFLEISYSSIASKAKEGSNCAS